MAEHSAKFHPQHKRSQYEIEKWRDENGETKTHRDKQSSKHLAYERTKLENLDVIISRDHRHRSNFFLLHDKGGNLSFAMMVSNMSTSALPIQDREIEMTIASRSVETTTPLLTSRTNTQSTQSSVTHHLQFLLCFDPATLFSTPPASSSSWWATPSQSAPS